MFLRLLKAKLHFATLTATKLHYQGSLTVDEDLLDATGLRPYEAVLVANVTTGARAETYIIKGPRGSKCMELNGAMARLGQVGDRLIVLAFGYYQPNEAPTHEPAVAILDENNSIIESHGLLTTP